MNLVKRFRALSWWALLMWAVSIFTIGAAELVFWPYLMSGLSWIWMLVMVFSLLWLAILLGFLICVIVSIANGEIEKAKQEAQRQYQQQQLLAALSRELDALSQEYAATATTLKAFRQERFKTIRAHARDN